MRSRYRRHWRYRRLLLFSLPIVVCACSWLWWPRAQVSASIRQWVAGLEVYPDHYITPEPPLPFHLYLPRVTKE